ncbi:MAG: M20 family metallopeptidase [FCB group bacterium]|jgi:amidohydrolase
MNNDKIISRIYELEPQIKSDRRHFHQNPELSFNEFETSKYIQKRLSDLNISFKVIAGTGVVALIGTGPNCVALRADMDALPIQEETGLEYASCHENIMHACGHDMHTAMLLCAAQVLKENESSLKGTVKLLFQPGEEKLPGGATKMLGEGVLENPLPRAIFGQHINPEEEVGKISASPGFILASADELYFTIKGKGSHAAQPHLGNDVILSASNLVVYLQSLITKFRNPLNPGLLSITSIQGGNATNVFPDEVKLMGTLRAYNQGWRELMHNEIETKSKQLCSLFNTQCEVTILKGYPALNNNPSTTNFIGKLVTELFGKEALLEFEPKMWAEDFAYYAAKIPATFWFLGVKPANQNEMPPLHTANLAPDENALVIGTILLVKSAVNFLNTD